MICLSCRCQEHTVCPGGTWCDCQHRSGAQVMSTADVARRWALPEVEDEPLADLLVRWCNRILSQDPRL